MSSNQLVTQCPYCNSPLSKTGYCDDKDHTFHGLSNTKSWYLEDKNLYIKVGKSISHPYYYAIGEYVNDFGRPVYKKFYPLKILLIKDAIKLIKKISKLKSFL